MEEDRLVQLNGNRMKEAEFWRTLWVVNAEPGTTKKDLLKPDYWAHVASRFKPLDRLEVRSDDGSFVAEYLVLTCERTYAKVKEIHWYDLEGKEVGVPDEALEEFEHRWRGPHGKWSVVRKSDDALMIEQLPNKETALQWIANKKAAA